MSGALKRARPSPAAADGALKRPHVPQTLESAVAPAALPLAPTNPLVSPLLTDLYQITMAYAYWQSGRQDETASFDLFFRKNPFHGEFTLFAGLEEVLRFLQSFRFSESDLRFIKETVAVDGGFIDWLRAADCSRVKVWAVPEGSVVFPRVPLLRVEGPLGIAQLLETTLLNLVNFPSLIATNAARMRLAAGKDKLLMEFGLRRAQGPDGAVSASKYSYMGGFDATSNVLAGKLTGIPVKGTHAHAYVQSYASLDDLKVRKLGACEDFPRAVLEVREALGFQGSNDGELAAFISYAMAFPDGFLALVDTYDTLSSGTPNAICVACALLDLGHKPVGVRLDSGDLAYFSKQVRDMLRQCAATVGKPELGELTIVASNDVNETVLLSLRNEGHEIDAFGIGTHLVTCQAQPALGCVYKLVEISGRPRIKLSQELTKVSLPGAKRTFRLFGRGGHPLVDLMMLAGEPEPQVGARVLCRHPFEAAKRCYVTPAKVELLQRLVWNGEEGVPEDHSISLEEIRRHTMDQLEILREDHLREVNPTPYKVSVSSSLYEFVHNLWQSEAPITELS